MNAETRSAVCGSAANMQLGGDQVLEDDWKVSRLG